MNKHRAMLRDTVGPMTWGQLEARVLETVEDIHTLTGESVRYGQIQARTGIAPVYLTPILELLHGQGAIKRSGLDAYVPGQAV